MEKPRNHENQEPVRPITPQEANDVKNELLPEEVLSTVNRLIAQNMRAGKSVIKQKDIVNELMELGLDRKDIFDKHWLDFEDVYRVAGWQVMYDKPGWNEEYDAYFKFEVPEHVQVRQRFGSTAVRQCTCGS